MIFAIPLQSKAFKKNKNSLLTKKLKKEQNNGSILQIVSGQQNELE